MNAFETGRKNDNSLDQIREDIAAIDNDILNLLSNRIELSQVEKVVDEPVSVHLLGTQTFVLNVLEQEFIEKIFILLQERYPISEDILSSILITDALIDCFYARMQHAKSIGAIKKEHHLPIEDLDQWQIVCERLKQQGKEYGISLDDEPFIQDIYDIIHEYSKKVQESLEERF